MRTSPEVDAYVENSPEFARPILSHIRSLVHKAIPETEETIKWKSPTFTLNGEIVIAMAAFKKHMVINFWRGQEISDPEGILRDAGKSKMRSIKNITKLEDLPEDDILLNYLREAMNLVFAGN